MRQSGFIVRFVDVVLILLFGFISISSIRQTEIDLPDSSETAPPGPEVEEVVFVGIRSDGTYLVDDERVALRGRGALRAYLAERLAALPSLPVKVRIRAAHDAPMGVLVDAAQLCDELGVAKAFEVRLGTPAG